MSGSVGKLSMVENNVNSQSATVGHYKGVMLCNRPFAGTMVSQKSQSSEAKAVFNCGMVSDPIGVNVSIPMKEKMIKRPKKDSVLVKHKKWLSDLQKTKERLEGQYIDDLRRKEEEKQRFQEQEKKMREVARSVLQESKQGSNENMLAADSKNTGPESDIPSAKEIAQSKAIVATKKPAWAMTEVIAGNMSEAKQQEEEDELLDFAKSLDYDRYITDMEVKMMMERLRKRIQDLEKEVEVEDQREIDAETRAAKREMLELMGKAESFLQEEEFNKARVNNEAYNAAKALLDDEEDMHAVHSTKSVATLLKNAKEKIGAVKESVRPTPLFNAEPKVLNEPKIVVHEPSDGARLEEKNNINKLPYMHRNPAV